MAVLDRDLRNYDPRTVGLLQSGPVLTFRHQPVLTDSIIHLKELGFVVHEIDCRECISAADIRNAILFKCRDPHHHYPNINGLQFWDLFSEVRVPEHGGLILVLWHFDEFMKQDESYYQDLLQILVGYHYKWLLFGEQFRIFIQTDEPDLKLNDIWSVDARPITFGVDALQEAPEGASRASRYEASLSVEQRERRRQQNQKLIRTLIEEQEARLANSRNLTSISRRDIQRSIESLNRSLANYEESKE